MNQFKRHIKSFNAFCCILFAAFFWAAGCATPNPDPLAGWKVLFSQDYEKLDKSISHDYLDYIQKLPIQDRKSATGPFWFYENGEGQHAVRIEIPLNGTWWEHVLIYDKDNKRIKTIKYSNGHYRS